MIKPPYQHGTPAPTSPRQDYVYLLVYGPTDVGKSTLALTAPGPLCYIHCSDKVEGILQRANARHIEQFKYPLCELDFGYTVPDINSIRVRPGGPSLNHLYMAEIESRCRAKWQEFIRVYSEAFTWARTIIIDPEFALYQLVRFAYFGGDSPDTDYERTFKGNNNVNRQAMWGPVNGDWFTYLKQAVRSQSPGKGKRHTNVILIAESADEYKPDPAQRGRAGTFDKKTGNIIPKTQQSTPRWVDVIVEAKRVDLSSGKSKYTATIRKPWDRESARGVEVDVTNNSTSFLDIMMEVSDDFERWER